MKVTKAAVKRQLNGLIRSNIETFRTDVSVQDANFSKELKRDIAVALSDGKGRPLSELAYMLRKNSSEIVQILSELVQANILKFETYNKKRYYFLHGNSVLNAHSADQIDEIKRSLRSPLPAKLTREACFARTCYGHLAGEVGVALKDSLLNTKVLEQVDNEYCLTETGKEKFTQFGIKEKSGKKFIGKCLDYSERRYHIAGEVGNQLTAYFFSQGWLKKRKGDRSVEITADGREALKKHFSLIFK